MHTLLFVYDTSNETEKTETLLEKIQSSECSDVNVNTNVAGYFVISVTRQGDDINRIVSEIKSCLDSVLINSRYLRHFNK